MSLEYRGEVAISLTVGLGATTNLQFEIGDLDIPDRASQNEIAFAAVDLSAEVLACGLWRRALFSSASAALPPSISRNAAAGSLPGHV
jgi:hypothetical protein